MQAYFVAIPETRAVSGRQGQPDSNARPAEGQRGATGAMGSEGQSDDAGALRVDEPPV